MRDGDKLPTRIGALDSLAASLSASLAVDASTAVAVRPVFAAARFSLRMDEAESTAVGRVAAFEIDIPLNTRAGSMESCVARLGPSEWFLIDAHREAQILAEEIETALSGRFHSLVDIGHRNTGIEVSGPHAVEVLNSGCPLNLSDAAFPANAATRTLLGKSEIILMRFAGPSRYRIECGRSFAAYVHDFLQDAALEFEPAETRLQAGR